MVAHLERLHEPRVQWRGPHARAPAVDGELRGIGPRVADGPLESVCSAGLALPARARRRLRVPRRCGPARALGHLRHARRPGLAGRHDRYPRDIRPERLPKPQRDRPRRDLHDTRRPAGPRHNVIRLADDRDELLCPAGAHHRCRRLDIPRGDSAGQHDDRVHRRDGQQGGLPGQPDPGGRAVARALQRNFRQLFIRRHGALLRRPGRLVGGPQRLAAAGQRGLARGKLLGLFSGAPDADW